MNEEKIKEILEENAKLKEELEATKEHLKKYTAPSYKKEYYENGDIPWIRSGEVNNKNIIDSDIKITQEGLDNSSAKLFPPRTVVIAMYGATAGQVGILNFECSTNQAVCGIYPNEAFIPEFLYYKFLDFKESLISQAVGGAQPNISQAKIKETYVPDIPLSEQKQIVALLDKAFEAIDKAKANIEQNIINAKELFQSKLNEIFSQKGEGWEEKTLGEVCVVERGSSPRPIKKFVTDSEDGVNWVKIGDVSETDKYVRSTKQKITKEGAQKSRFVDVGDFILSNSMSFGRPYIMKVPGYIHDGWFVFRLPDSLNPDYFWQLLASPYLKEQFNDLAAGAIVKNISGDLVKKAIIPLPPLEKQVQIFDETEKLKKDSFGLIRK